MAQFDYASAKAAGYSDNEIAAFLAPQYKFNLDAAFTAGYSPAEVVSFLSQQSPQEESGFFRQAADLPVGVAKGVVTGTRLISDVFGAESGVSTTLRGVEDYLGDLMSAQSKRDSQEVARIMAEAEDAGVGEQLKAAARAFAVAPLDFTTQALGTAIPTALAGTAVAMAAPAAPALAAGATMLGLGAAQGAGVVKSAIYDAVQEELLAAGVSKEQAKAAAAEAQAYGGENLNLILTGGVLGAIANRAGVEPALIRTAVGKAATRAAATEAAEAKARQGLTEMAGRGAVRQAVTTGAAEAGTEAIQAGQEQAAANIALQRAGFEDVPTMRGVVGSAALEGLAGLGVGAPAGALEPGRARRALEQEELDTDLLGDALLDLANMADELGDTQAAEEYRRRATSQAESEAQADEGVDTTPEPATTEMSDEDVAEALRTAVQAEEQVADEVDETVEEAAPVSAEVGVEEPPVTEATVEEAAPVSAEVGVEEPPVTEATVEEAAPVGADVGVEEAAPVGTGAGVEGAPQPVGARPKLGLKRAAQQTAGTTAPTTSIVGPKVTVVGKGFRREETAVSPQVGAAPTAETLQKQRMRENKARTSAADRALKSVSAPLPPTGPDGTAPPKLISAVRNRSAGLANAYRILAADPEAKTKAGQTARDVLAHPSVTDKERRAAQKAAKSSPEIATARADRVDNAASAKPNPALRKITNALQAAMDIGRNGNKFERALANRLKPFLRGVQVVLVTDVNQMPEQAREAFVGDGVNAEGLFYAAPDGSKTIYLNDIPGENGVDNLTFLHEALHAATLQTIQNYYENPELLTDAQREIVAELEALRDHAVLTLADRINGGIATEAEKAFFEVGAFTDPREFITYGMTHPAMQRILLGMDPVTAGAGDTNPSLLSAFVQLLRKLFGLGGDAANAFADLVTLTDDLLTAIEVDVPTGVAVAAMKKQSRQQGVQTKINASTKATDSVGAIGNAIRNVRRDVQGAVDTVSSSFDVAGRGVFKAMLSVFTTEDVIRAAGTKLVDKAGAAVNAGNVIRAPNGVEYKVNRIGSFGVDVSPTAKPTTSKTMTPAQLGLREAPAFDNLGKVTERVNDSNAWRSKEMRGLFEDVEGWAEWQQKNPDAGRTLANMTYASTLLNADPTAYATLTDAVANDPELIALRKKSGDPTLSVRQKAAVKGEITKRTNDFKFMYQLKAQLEKQGGAKGPKIFQMARDNYVRMLNETLDTLKQKVTNSSMQAAGKSKLLAKLDADFAEARRLGVYFPLVRYGNYWLRVGKGKSGAFYMFESALDRDVFAKRVARERGVSLDELLTSEELDRGDGTESLRKDSTTGPAASEMLKSVFQMLDAGGIQDVEQLKNDIYQLYLYTLPDSSMRRRFIRRKGKTGFSTDALRNYTTTQLTSINQLARLKYKDSIELALSSSKDELQGRSKDDIKLQIVVDEVAKRVNMELNPASPDDVINNFSTLGTKLVFYYMMTAPKTAFIQLTQLPVVGLPILASKYGWGKTSAVALKHMNLFRTLGTTRTTSNGDVITEWGAPSLQNSAYITKNPDPARRAVLAQAWETLNNRGLFMETYVSDLVARGDGPSVEQTPLFSLRTITNLMAGAFHHTERISREIMGMSAFELAYDAAIAKKMPPKDAMRAALAEAETSTYEGLFNYSQFNKPRVSRIPALRVGTQFLTFPIQMTSYLVRNAWGHIKASPTKTRKQSMQLFWGTLGMTALFSGATGLPLYGAIMGALDAYKDAIRADLGDDDDDLKDLYDPSNPLGRMNSDLWFRSWFLNSYFGPGSDVAKALGLSDTQALTLARAAELGPISAFTDINFNPSVGLDSLWFSDDKVSATNRSAFESMLLKFGGPLASLGSNMAGALDDFEGGDVQRGLEKLTPAFFRGPLAAYRQSQEGQKTKQGFQVMDREFYTTAKLLFKGLGFQSTTEAEVQEAGFLAMKFQRAVEAERNKLVDLAGKAIMASADDPLNAAKTRKLQEVLEQITEFNMLNAFVPITPSTLDTSITNKAESRAMSSNGISLDSKFAPIIYPMLKPELYKN